MNELLSSPTIPDSADPAALIDSADLPPVTVVLDMFVLVPGASGGIVPWIKGVVREMVRLYPQDRLLLVYRGAHPPIRVDGPNVVEVQLPEDGPSYHQALGDLCHREGASALIRSYPHEEHPAFPFHRQIFVIPDMQHDFYPEFFQRHILAARRRGFAFAMTRGGAIATMTDHSRATMVNHPWTMCRDVFLMPAALTEEIGQDPGDAPLPDEAAGFDRFFFMPANIWAHKNHRRLFEAFARALPNLPANTGLVLTGSPDGFQAALAGYEALPIVHLGFVSHPVMASLFRRATALVYFSLFEGFGMPLLEAFHHGTPVICSGATALAEVGGDAVLACDPTNPDAMAALMLQIIGDEALRQQLVARGRDRLKVYDWTAPARNLREAVVRRSTASPVPTLEQPLVSIVMPTRNHGQFIRRSIDSVLSQTYPHIELLVRDGASTDNTVDILKSYGDRIRWVSEKDKGQTDAINKGMAETKGQILAYLNSDDILTLDAVERAIRFFQDHPECDLVYGDADYIDADDKIIGQYNTAEFSFERLMNDNCICQPASFWRRRIAERTGSFNAELQTAMDYEYWLRVANAGGIIYFTPQKLAQSRLHDDAKTLAMRGKIFAEIFQICKEQGGYVSMSYIHGFWAYRLFETWFGGRWLQRSFPHAYAVPATLHFAWMLSRIHGDLYAKRFLARSMYDALHQRAPHLAVRLREAWRRFRGRG
jgi:glycosyltransferase involved in cell wall biosynthesis